MTQITADPGQVIQITFETIILEINYDFVQVSAYFKVYNGLRNCISIPASCNHDRDHQRATDDQQLMQPGSLGVISDRLMLGVKDSNALKPSKILQTVFKKIHENSSKKTFQLKDLI